MGKIIQLISVFVLITLAYSTYDPFYGKILSEYSEVSYCNDFKKTDWTCGAPCNRVEKLQEVRVMKGPLEAQGYVGYRQSENAIVVVFRGTVPWQIMNWMTDLDMTKTKYPLCNNNCEVHQGFLKAFNFLKPQMFTNIKELKAKYPTAKLFVTGHSLGGAMATLAVPEIFREFKIQVNRFYTIGCPRVGDLNFSNWWASNKFAIEEARITHNCDPVPHLPGASLGYYHIGKEVFYKAFHETLFTKAPLYVACENPEDKRCANSCLIPGNVNDHTTYFDINFGLEEPICYL